MSVNERINFLITQVEMGNKSAFAEKIGSKSGVIGDLVGGRLNKPSFGMLEKIARAYPSVNTEWLLTGEGEPFKKNTGTTPAVSTPGTLHKNVSSSNNNIRVGTGTTPPETGTDIDYYRQRIRDLENKYDTLLEKYERLLTKKE